MIDIVFCVAIALAIVVVAWVFIRYVMMDDYNGRNK